MKTCCHTGRWVAVAISLLVAGSAIAAPPSARESAARARMENWRNQRFGLFIHWGPYSELGGTYEGKAYPGNTEWIMRTAKISRQDYRTASASFDPTGFKASDVVASAKAAGFRYIILTAKHYDGYALFDSRVSDFDSTDVMPSKRDLVAEFATACKEASMPLGFSYALDRDWYHPGGNTLGRPWDPAQAGFRDRYLRTVALPQLRELSIKYGTVFAMHANPGPGVPDFLQSEFDAAIDSGTVLPWGFSGRGDYTFTDGRMFGNSLAPVDWEKCNTLGGSWGFRRGKVNWESTGEILRELVKTASLGGNYLLNVGLDGNGQIPEGARTILGETGAWLARHGEAIYGTSGSPFSRHPWDGGATVRKEADGSFSLYLHVFSAPGRELVLEGLLPEPSSARVMGTEKALKISGYPGSWQLDTAGVDPAKGVEVIRVKLPSYPMIGSGPLVVGADGRCRLQLGRGRFPDERSSIGRTASSPRLRLTSFRDEKERGIWQVRSTVDRKVKLRMSVLRGTLAQDSRVSVKVGGGPVTEFTPSSESSGTRAQGSLQALVAVSPSFGLPAGISSVEVRGGVVKEGSPTPAPLTILDLELIPDT